MYPNGHKTINLYQAIEQSCDFYFYNVGKKTYEQPTPVLQNGVRKFGFGRSTGIDLPGETQRSVVPDKVWAREHGTEWKTGDEINLAIGQGYLQATPLQMAVALSALVNGGTVWVPHIGHADHRLVQPGHQHHAEREAQRPWHQAGVPRSGQGRPW